MIRRTMVLAAAAGLLLAWPSPAAAQDQPAPDIVDVLNDFFTSEASADAKETLGWTKLPQPIALGDPTDEPGTADVTGAATATTEPLGDDAFRQLFGPTGVLTTHPAARLPTTSTLDVEAFRDGMLITVITPRAPVGAITGAQDQFIAAVEAFDPRFPSPPSGNFTGINKAWRYVVSPAGADVDYRQFDGAQFGAFKSPTVVLDTCATAPGPGCFYGFFTALSSTAIEGIDTIHVELFHRAGPTSAFDRTAPQPFAALVPGALGLVAVPAAPPPAVQPEPEPAVDATPEVVAPAADDGEGDGDGTVWPFALLAGGSAVVVAGVTVRVRAGRKEPESVLSYALETGAVVVDDDTVRAEWSALLAREAEIQQRLLADYQRIAGVVAQQAKAFTGALATYDEGYQDVAWNAQWLQGVADETLAAQQYTSAFDLVLGVGDLGINLWRLGKGGWSKVGDEAVDAAGSSTAAATATTAVDRGADIIASSPELQKVAADVADANMGDLGNAFAEAVALGADAGLDVKAVVPDKINIYLRVMNMQKAVDTLWLDMAETLVKQKGFLALGDDARMVITAGVTNLRSFCQGGAVSVGEAQRAIDALQAFTSRPGFFDEMGRYYVVVGGAGSTETALEIAYHADDISFLRWVTDKLDAGTPVTALPGLWETALGPVGTAGASIAADVQLGSKGATLLSLGNGVGDGVRLLDVLGGPATATSVMPDGVTYVSQLGILRPTFFGMEAGDSLGLTMLFNGINSVGGLTTWLTGMRGSIEGGLLYDDAQAELGPTYTSMATSTVDMINALEVIGERVTTDSIAVDDRNALAALLDDMTACVNRGSPSLRDELGPQLQERTDHITAKLAQLNAVQGVLVTAAQGLPGIAVALDDATGGRGGRTWADPRLAAGFGVAAAAVGSLVAGVLRPPVAIAASDDGERGAEVFDRSFEGSYLEANSDDPPEPDGDTSDDEFFTRLNAADPVDER